MNGVITDYADSWTLRNKPYQNWEYLNKIRSIITIFGGIVWISINISYSFHGTFKTHRRLGNFDKKDAWIDGSLAFICPVLALAESKWDYIVELEN